MSVGGDHCLSADAAGAAPRVAKRRADDSRENGMRAVPAQASGRGNAERWEPRPAGERPGVRAAKRADAAAPGKPAAQHPDTVAPNLQDVAEGEHPQATGEVRRGAPGGSSPDAQAEEGAHVPAEHRPQIPRARAVVGDLTDTTAGIDDPAFRDYVRSRSRSLLRTAYLLTGNAADAEDLVQSALAKTYLAWDKIEDRGALDGYVRRAMVNTHISWWRRRRLEEFPTDEIPDQVVADHAVTSDLQESLRRAIDRLPQRMRAAIMLRYYDDMTEAEVAEVLGVSLGTVKSTVSRAMAKLRIDAELQAD